MTKGLKTILITIGGIHLLIGCNDTSKENYIYEKSDNFKEIIDNSIDPEKMEQPPIKALNTKQSDNNVLDDVMSSNDDLVTEINSFNSDNKNANTVVAIKEKVYFYNNPNYDSKTKKYFVMGQKGQYYEHQNNNINNDFIYINFEYNGNITSGYILKTDVIIE